MLPSVMVSDVRLFDSEYGCIASGLVRADGQLCEPPLHRDSFGYWYDDDSGDVSYDLFIQPEQLYFRYPEVVPKVNWLRVIIPKDCEHCLCRRDIVFYISIDGQTCSTLPEGAVFEQ